MLSYLNWSLRSFSCLLFALSILCFGSCTRYCSKECEKDALRVFIHGFTVVELDTIILETYDAGTVNLIGIRMYRGSSFSSYDSSFREIFALPVEGKNYRIHIPATGDEYRIKEMAYAGPETEVYKCKGSWSKKESEFVCHQDVSYIINNEQVVARTVRFDKR